MLWQCTWHNPNYRKENHKTNSLSSSALSFCTPTSYYPGLSPFSPLLWCYNIFFIYMIYMIIYLYFIFCNKNSPDLEGFILLYNFIFLHFIHLFFIFIGVTLVNMNQIWEGEKVLWLESGWQVFVFLTWVVVKIF